MQRYPPLLPGVSACLLEVRASCLEVRVGYLEVSSRVASRSHLRVASRFKGTNLKTKIVNSMCFFGPSDRNELYHTPFHYYPKYEVWAIENFGGRIPLMLVCAPREWSVQDSNKQARQRTGGPSFVENASVHFSAWEHYLAVLLSINMETRHRH